MAQNGRCAEFRAGAVPYAPARGVTTFFYDAQNRLPRTLFADGSERKTIYDEAGRRTAEVDQAGQRTEFVYDNVGRLSGVKQLVGGRTLLTTYAYDERGDKTAQTDANGHVTRFEYDSAGRLSRRILPDGKSESQTYDAFGRLTGKTDIMGRTIGFSYDAVTDRLLSRNYPDASSVAFTYTADGRRSTVTDSRGVTRYEYDPVMGRLQKVTDPSGRELEYTYNENGARASLKATAGATTFTTTYGYDDLNRLSVVTDPLGHQFIHGYDSNGNRASLQYPNGVITNYSYNTLNRLTNITAAKGGTTLAGFTYTLGPTGNRTKLEEADGTVKDYTCDNLYRLTGETVTRSASPIYSNTFGYDPVGNRLSQNRTVSSPVGSAPAYGASASYAYTYDSRDRLLTENTGSNTWDDNGNLVGASGTRPSPGDHATYSWDFDNRLIGVQKADGTIIAYQYDADGNRVQTRTTIAGVTTTQNYLVDIAGGLSQVVLDVDGGGTVTTYYTRGDDLLGLIRPTGNRYYHADGLGSIRTLTDDSGAVTDSYQFSAFGELLNHAGSDAQPFLFTGEPLDLNSGFAYHRARWMDPGKGSFISADIADGRNYAPVTLHRYLYSGNNPVQYVDPSGLEFNFLSTLITNTILGGLIGGSISALQGGSFWKGAADGARFAAGFTLLGGAAGYYALGGNIARGVYLVGTAAGMSSLGFQGIVVYVAPDEEERNNALIGLASTIGAMYLGPKFMEAVNTKSMTAENVNSQLAARNPSIKPPYHEGTIVQEVTLMRSAKYVRVFDPASAHPSQPVGRWLAAPGEVEGLTPAEIASKLALPDKPMWITTIDVPAGSTIRIGTAGPNFGGEGGAIQIEFVDGPQMSSGLHKPL